MLGARLASAAVGLPVLFLAAWFGDPWYSTLLALAAAVAAWETLRLLAPGSGRLATALVLVGAVGLTFGGRASEPIWLFLVVLVGWAALLLAERARRRDSETPTRWLGAVLLVGIPLGLYLALRNGPDGRAWVFLALGTTFANDTGAYVLGRLAGRHRLAPNISPRKTWEGAIAGLAAGALACWALDQVQGLPLWTGWALALGLGLAVAGQAGDLFESHLKRRAGIKDASALIPGHGGLLDRLDSLLPVGILAYVAARLASGT
jgi:phosphatidate cytidylyltransferase